MLRKALFVIGLTVVLLAAAFGLLVAVVQFSWDEVPPPPATIAAGVLIAPRVRQRTHEQDGTRTIRKEEQS